MSVRFDWPSCGVRTSDGTERQYGYTEYYELEMRAQRRFWLNYLSNPDASFTDAREVGQPELKQFQPRMNVTPLHDAMDWRHSSWFWRTLGTWREMKEMPSNETS